MSRLLILLIVFALEFSGSLVLFGQNENEGQQFLPPEDLVLRFVDAEGEPIPEVDLKAANFVYQGDSGRSFMVRLSDENGNLPKSNAEGFFKSPVRDVGLGNVARMMLKAEHEEFVSFSAWFAINQNGPTTI